jgi:AcrR family transcriptional regulator
VPKTISSLAGSLRERKKLKTRESIQREAMRLIQKQGYEKTTIEQIAAAVEISPSTFFNYFPNKEDVVLYDAYDPMIGKLLLERPADEPLSVAIRNVLEEMAGIFERDREIILARARLWLDEPSLRARLWEELERGRDFMSMLIAQRSGRDADDFDIRVTVMVIVMAAMEAMREWVRHDGQGSFVTTVSHALDLVDAQARLDKLALPRPTGT